MPNDLLQIGSFYFSKTLLDVLAPLLGTLIGGLITFLTTRKLEMMKWDKERKDKLNEQYREALGMVMEWLDPFEIAIAELGILFNRLLDKNVSIVEFDKVYPRLLTELGRRNPPRRLQAILPDDVYKRSKDIEKSIVEFKLKVEVDFIYPIPTEKPIDKFYEYRSMLEQINELVKDYTAYLNQEYIKTFEQKSGFK